MQYRVPLYRVHCPPGVGDAIERHLRSGRVANGPGVERFEGLLGEYLGNRLVTSTSDVSTSLVISLYMAGVRPGDEVVASPMACLATNSPVRNLFAKFRWCDINPVTGNMDATALASAITPRTRAILVYHWAGNPAELEPIYKVARSHGIPVVEDAGEALGAEYQGRKIGNTGADYTVFSFYPNRHITTGEGGAIAFSSAEEYERGRWLKRYGIHQPSFRTPLGEINPASDIAEAGWNSYLNHLEAEIGVAQMGYLKEIVSTHQANGLYYDEALRDIKGLRVLQQATGALSAYWVYTVLAERPKDLLRHLRDCGVQASKVHVRTDIYSCFGSDSVELPGVTYFDNHCLSIPSGWWVTLEDREYISQCISKGW